MKRTVLLTEILACFVAVSLLAGCDPVNGGSDYVRLSDTEISFAGADNMAKTIKVETESKWNATTEAAWLTISDITADSFNVIALDNDTDQERSAEIIVKAGAAKETLKVNQMAPNHKFHRYRAFPDYQQGTVMSPSGKYAGGFYNEIIDKVTVFYIVITDLITGEDTQLGPFPFSVVSLFEPGCITDNGEIIIATEGSRGNIMFDLEENQVDILPPSGFTKLPEISGVSADGTMVGWSGKEGFSYPFKWVNGEAVELPKPEKNFRDEPIGDVQARGISANGKIIYGTTWDNKDYGMVYWDESGKVQYVGHDVHKISQVERPDGVGGTYKYNIANGMCQTAVKNCVSPNGKWIAGVYRTESWNEETEMVDQVDYPAFFNTEIGKTYIFEELRGGGGVTASDEGLGFTVDAAGISEMATPSTGKVVDIEKGIVIDDVLPWIESTYGITINSGYMYYMPNKDTFLGAMLYSGGATVEGINWVVMPPR